MRMLGRIALGAFCECCNDNRGTRKSKRREQRLTERELADEFAAWAEETDEWARTSLPLATETWPAT
jgi:hypothetical protein